MTYRLTKQADQDIVEIYSLGAEQFGVVQADRYANDLFDTLELLASNPRIARERSELKPPVRLHPFGAHLIAYLVRSDHILIVRVLHGRKDWHSLFS